MHHCLYIYQYRTRASAPDSSVAMPTTRVSLSASRTGKTRPEPSRSASEAQRKTEMWCGHKTSKCFHLCGNVWELREKRVLQLKEATAFSNQRVTPHLRQHYSGKHLVRTPAPII